MLIPSSSRMWLGRATLVSLLLASSLTVSASSQTVTTTPVPRFSVKPMLTASSIVSFGTYTEAVRKQMQRIPSPVVPKLENDSILEKSVPTPSDSVTVVAQETQPAESATVQPAMPVTAQPTKLASAQAPKSKPKQVQIAVASKPEVSRSVSSALVNNALSLVGVPYIYGGTSRSGFDCSGFTLYVFEGSGISLPRVASSQFNVGSSVNKAQLQSGDLVFFTTYAPGPSHVGIYIGGGSFVHASNSGVRTSSLSEGYYAGRYIGARRIS